MTPEGLAVALVVKYHCVCERFDRTLDHRSGPHVAYHGVEVAPWDRSKSSRYAEARWRAVRKVAQRFGCAHIVRRNFQSPAHTQAACEALEMWADQTLGDAGLPEDVLFSIE